MIDNINQAHIKNLNEDTTQDTICVDLHCHSTFSDGTLPPKKVAKNLFDYGVKYASLTDHNTLSGLSAFKRALMKYGIGYISGVEITTMHKGDVLHLLA